MNEHKSPIDQFGAVAGRYARSSVHASGYTLKRVIELVQPEKDQTALDVATGAGHMAVALAPYVHTVFATDITPQMLYETRKLAQSKGVTNIRFEIVYAGNLPYPEETFDIVTCRIAAHHFPDVPAFVREAVRVLKPGGRLALVDDTVPEDPEADRFLNRVEWLRDRSHVRNYTPAEWKGFFGSAGLTIESIEVTTDLPEGMSYREWMYRANASEEVTEEVKRMLLEAPEKAKESYGIREEEDDLRLSIPVVVIAGRK